MRRTGGCTGAGSVRRRCYRHAVSFSVVFLSPRCPFRVRAEDQARNQYKDDSVHSSTSLSRFLTPTDVRKFRFTLAYILALFTVAWHRVSTREVRFLRRKYRECQRTAGAAAHGRRFRVAVARCWGIFRVRSSAIRGCLGKLHIERLRRLQAFHYRRRAFENPSVVSNK
jgi:hypothetical protein